MKNSKLKFSEYMQNISRSKSFGKFVLIVLSISCSMSGVLWLRDILLHFNLFKKNMEARQPRQKLPKILEIDAVKPN